MKFLFAISLASLLIMSFSYMSCNSKSESTPETALKKPLQLILIGGPGAGKGAQAVLLKEKFDIPHISTGEMLRNEVDRGTKTGLQIAHILQKGELVSDELMLTMVEDRLRQPDCQNGFILDGFPRTRGQAKGLETILAKLGRPDITVLYIEVSDRELFWRLQNRGRTDDADSTIQHRIRKFHEQTEPAITYYEEKGNLIHINGEQPVEAVTKEILSVLEKIR